MTDLCVTIAGVRLQNPVIAASGTFGYGREYAGIIDIARLGGICTKGLTLNPRPGNDGIRVWETPSGLLNSIGLENPGIPAFIENELPRLRSLGPAVIANLSGSTVEEYAEGAALLNATSIDMVELNISCPNVKAGGMAFGLDPEAASSVVRPVREALSAKPLMVKLSPNAPDIIAVARACVNAGADAVKAGGMAFGLDPEAAASVVAPVRRALGAKPLMVKLSPNAPDVVAVARACVSAGADALSLVNTFKAMAIDLKNRKSVFDNISAGLSGPAIKPIALRMVWELCGEIAPVPVVGLGGIASAADALEFLMAGAAAVQVGSATFAHPQTVIEIIDGIEAYLRHHGIGTVAALSLRR